MSDTPRTDAQRLYLESLGWNTSTYAPVAVIIKGMEQIERELDVMTRNYESLLYCFGRTQERMIDAERLLAKMPKHSENHPLHLPLAT